MTTISKRLDRLEQAAGARRREVIFLKDGVYHRGAEVITQEEYEALKLSADVLTIEVCYTNNTDR